MLLLCKLSMVECTCQGRQRSRTTSRHDHCHHNRPQERCRLYINVLSVGRSFLGKQAIRAKVSTIGVVVMENPVSTSTPME